MMLFSHLAALVLLLLIQYVQGDGECGGSPVNARHTICCNGLLYIRSGFRPACCGSVGYDAHLFQCCGNSIVRKEGKETRCCGSRAYDAHVQQCRHGYLVDRTGIGSTCCQTSSGWRCCNRGENCCSSQDVEVQGSGGAIDVPGFRPACCTMKTRHERSSCCRQAVEKAWILPPCCDAVDAKPLCCTKPDGQWQCCAAEEGYCCTAGSTIVDGDMRQSPQIGQPNIYQPPDRGQPDAWQPTDRGQPNPRQPPNRVQPAPYQPPDRGQSVHYQPPDRGQPDPYQPPDRVQPDPWQPPDRGQPDPYQLPDSGRPDFWQPLDMVQPNSWQLPDRGAWEPPEMETMEIKPLIPDTMNPNQWLPPDTRDPFSLEDNDVWQPVSTTPPQPIQWVHSVEIATTQSPVTDTCCFAPVPQAYCCSLIPVQSCCNSPYPNHICCPSQPQRPKPSMACCHGPVRPMCCYSWYQRASCCSDATTTDYGNVDYEINEDFMSELNGQITSCCSSSSKEQCCGHGQRLTGRLPSCCEFTTPITLIEWGSSSSSDDSSMEEDDEEKSEDEGEPLLVIEEPKPLAHSCCGVVASELHSCCANIFRRTGIQPHCCGRSVDADTPPRGDIPGDLSYLYLADEPDLDDDIGSCCNVSAGEVPNCCREGYLNTGEVFSCCNLKLHTNKTKAAAKDNRPVPTPKRQVTPKESSGFDGCCGLNITESRICCVTLPPGNKAKCCESRPNLNNNGLRTRIEIKTQASSSDGSLQPHHILAADSTSQVNISCCSVIDFTPRMQCCRVGMNHFRRNPNCCSSARAEALARISRSYKPATGTAPLPSRHVVQHSESYPRRVVAPPNNASRKYRRDICGRRLYDMTTHICCQGRINIKRGLHPKCCDHLTYDASIYQCCANNFVSKTCGAIRRHK